MPRLECSVCKKEWEIPGRILGDSYITHYPRVWCPHHDGLVAYAKIVEKEKKEKPKKRKVKVTEKPVESELTLDQVKQELRKKLKSGEYTLSDLMRDTDAYLGNKNRK